jgi:DNA-binding NarL/FixJ family response regulator
MPEEVIKIALIDAHLMIRSGMVLQIEHQPDMKVVVEAGSVSEALEWIKLDMPDLVLLALGVRDEDCAQAAHQILAEFPSVKIVVIADVCDPVLVEKALESGVAGYVMKENLFDEVIRAVRTVMTGQLYLCPVTTTAVMRRRNAVGAPEAVFAVSDREKQLLRLVSAGLRNKEIAVQMEITSKSVETYRARLKKKLNCDDTAGLILYAVRNKIVIA